MATMVRIVYTPEGGSKREWSIDMDNPPWDITYGVEKATNWAWSEFGDRLANTSVIALRALIYILRKRDEPRLEIDSVQVLFSEIDLQMDEDLGAVSVTEDPKETD